MSLQGKNIAVIGVGVSGLASLKLAKALGATITAVNSGNTEEWAPKLIELGECGVIEQSDPKLSDSLAKSDLIVLSPGIARESKFLEKSLIKNIPVISEIELAYRAINLDSTKIISVTGTNGKTTTVTILDILSRGAGKEVFLGGNIGTPLATYALEVLEKRRSIADIIILELSSFQLESMVSFKSDVAAILNISENHGERYDKVLDYALAKFHITDRMSEKKKVYIGELGEFAKDFNPNCEVIKVETPLSLDPIFESKFHLIGEHNLSNLSFATLLLESVGVDWKLGVGALSDFHGVKFRLQKRPAKINLKVFNDAKSTNWEATLTALKASVFSYPNLKINLILGGQLRGHGDELGSKLDRYKENISKIYFYGESGELLFNESATKFNSEYFKNMNEVIGSIANISEAEVVLFSPAFPSFDLYKNYIKRGEHFDELVNEYLLQ
ncbi:UDP-N-acetylmuramoyl-L-alanine--D-glutamate ligase [Halobacteriovorax sp.]|uniref:UDP-N-acetylmuramoyl-L-alanine--D-glutamate ligase n=1 Tax=Halobacteriovorax sp. TaxID=2020862 RepID=UPI003568A3B3